MGGHNDTEFFTIYYREPFGIVHTLPTVSYGGQPCGSNDAKVLYALMLDRASISKVNGFIEADGTIRLYFTVEQAQKKLHRSRQCVTRIFRELEYSGLICRKKQGLGKPALITLNYPSNAKLIRPKEAGENLSG